MSSAAATSPFAGGWLRSLVAFLLTATLVSAADTETVAVDSKGGFAAVAKHSDDNKPADGVSSTLPQAQQPSRTKIIRREPAPPLTIVPEDFEMEAGLGEEAQEEQQMNAGSLAEIEDGIGSRPIRKREHNRVKESSNGGEAKGGGKGKGHKVIAGLKSMGVATHIRLARSGILKKGGDGVGHIVRRQHQAVPSGLVEEEDNDWMHGPDESDEPNESPLLPVEEPESLTATPVVKSVHDEDVDQMFRETEPQDPALLSPLVFGTHVSAQKDFLSKADGAGWAKVQAGTVIQGLVIEKKQYKWAYFTNLRDDTPAGKKNSIKSNERFAPLSCHKETWHFYKGLKECAAGYYLAGLQSVFSPPCYGRFANGLTNGSAGMNAHCVQAAWCCKPHGLQARWGTCQPWEAAEMRSEQGVKSAICPSKNQAVVGLYYDWLTQAIAGIKCCTAPAVSFCDGHCPKDKEVRPDHRNYCRREQCTEEECCFSGPSFPGGRGLPGPQAEYKPGAENPAVRQEYGPPMQRDVSIDFVTGMISGTDSVIMQGNLTLYVTDSSVLFGGSSSIRRTLSRGIAGVIPTDLDEVQVGLQLENHISEDWVEVTSLFGSADTVVVGYRITLPARMAENLTPTKLSDLLKLSRSAHRFSATLFNEGVQCEVLYMDCPVPESEEGKKHTLDASAKPDANGNRHFRMGAEPKRHVPSSNDTVHEKISSKNRPPRKPSLPRKTAFQSNYPSDYISHPKLPPHAKGRGPLSQSYGIHGPKSAPLSQRYGPKLAPLSEKGSARKKALPKFPKTKRQGAAPKVDSFTPPDTSPAFKATTTHAPKSGKTSSHGTTTKTAATEKKAMTFKAQGVGKSKVCDSDTGGTCTFSACQQWRNAVCTNGKCLCKGPRCSVSGICSARVDFHNFQGRQISWVLGGEYESCDTACSGYDLTCQVDAMRSVVSSDAYTSPQDVDALHITGMPKLTCEIISESQKVSILPHLYQESDCRFKSGEASAVEEITCEATPDEGKDRRICACMLNTATSAKTTKDGGLWIIATSIIGLWLLAGALAYATYSWRHKGAASKLHAWEVVAVEGAKVYSAKDPTVPQVGEPLKKGDVVKGRKDGDWAQLIGEPAFVRIAEGGDVFLSEAELWFVAHESGGTVYSEKDTKSEALGELGSKAVHMTVVGRQDGLWLALVGEPGFMLISEGEVKFLKQAEEPAAPPGTLAEDAAVAANVPGGGASAVQSPDGAAAAVAAAAGSADAPADGDSAAAPAAGQPPAAAGAEESDED